MLYNNSCAAGKKKKWEGGIETYTPLRVTLPEQFCAVVTHSLLLWLDNKNNGREEEKKRFHVAAQFMGNADNQQLTEKIKKQYGKDQEKKERSGNRRITLTPK